MSDRGYLVVLRHPTEAPISNNPGYRGLNRLPPIPASSPSEARAIDAYIFGAYADEAGLIPTLPRAEDLLLLFPRSAREYEIIFVQRCGSASAPGTPSGDLTPLGFDVAGEESPFWSIVFDFPSSPTVHEFSSLLNENGLFNLAEAASAYLDAYRSNRLPDFDLPLTVWGVYEVK